MEISQIISRNLTELMASYPGRETLAKVARAAHVGFGTVQRARNGDGNLTVQNLDLIAGEIDTMNAAEQEKQKRRGEVFAEQERLKRERCAELVKLAKGADDDSKTYRYHQGLIDDANRRKKEAEAAHFTECYGRYR